MKPNPTTTALLVSCCMTAMLSTASLARAEDVPAPATNAHELPGAVATEDAGVNTETQNASGPRLAKPKPKAEKKHSITGEVLAAIGGQAIGFGAGAFIGLAAGPFGVIIGGGIGLGVLSVFIVPALVDSAGTDSVSTGSYWWSALGAFIPMAAASAAFYIADATHDWDDENADSPWSSGVFVGGVIGGAILLQVVGAVLFYELSRHPVDDEDEKPKRRARGFTVYPLASVSPEGSALFGLNGTF